MAGPFTGKLGARLSRLANILLAFPPGPPPPPPGPSVTIHLDDAALGGFRNALSSAVPKWLQNRPGFQVGFKFLWSICAMLDFLSAQVTEGQIASWPGVGTPTALPLVAQSRGILRGEAESTAKYSARAVRWLDTWEGAGSSEVLAEEIQSYLGNTPMVRIVDRSGNWVTRASDGTVTKVQAGSAAWAWDWDSKSNPVRASTPWWSDLWIIVYPCEWAVTPGTTGGGGLAAIWGNRSIDVGIGHAVNRAANDAIRSLAQIWKGAHTWVEAIVWSYDPTLFDHAVINAGNPNGTWGEWGYAASAASGLQVARNPSCRYWIPPNG